MRRLALVFALAFSLAGAASAAEPPATVRSRAAEARAVPRIEAAMGQAGVRLGAPVFLRITKQPAQLELWAEAAGGAFRLVKSYPICAFSGALGPKKQVGDLQAPEGFYAVPAGRMNPASAFHLSFDLGYPNVFDRAHGRTGSALMVHGNCVSIGCYAMGDGAIEEIWSAMAAAFRAGQPFVRVHVYPFAMNPGALAAHADSPHAAFWANLQAGWDWFERAGRPPDVRVRGAHYVFSPG